MEKNSFVMYTDYRQHIELLTREQKGDLLSAIFAYADEDNLPEMDGMTQMAFSFIKGQMDRDKEKYNKVVEKRSQAGKQGGRPKANALSEKQTKAKKANAFSEKQMKAKKADTVNDTDTVNDINNKNTLCKADAIALFERLWKAYPNKRGKGQVSDTAKVRLLKIGEEHMLRALTRYIEDLKQDEWRKPQNGSTFFNSGYEDYLDENYEPPVKPKAKSNAYAENMQKHGDDYYDFDNLERKFIHRINGE